MRTDNYNKEVMNNLEKCGVITCIHCIDGFCSNCKACELYERTFVQEH
ncbi:hypothetical protein QBE52_05090 [Clostridiaceae bacterium 35-E11]